MQCASENIFLIERSVVKTGVSKLRFYKFRLEINSWEKLPVGSLGLSKSR